MAPDQGSPAVSERRPASIGLLIPIRGALMALAGGSAVIAGVSALAAAGWSLAFARPRSPDPTIWLVAFSALGFGAAFLIWGTRALVTSGFVATNRQLSRPVVGLIGLLLLCLAALLLLSGFALIGLSVFTDAGVITLSPALADPLVVGILLAGGAFISAAIGGKLIGSSNCIVGLRPPSGGNKNVIAG